MTAVASADERLMALALEQAEGAAEHGDVPIGAVVAREGEPLAAAGNERELRGDPTAHAEMLAMQRGIAPPRRLAPARLRRSTSPSSRARCARARSSWRAWTAVVYAAPDPKAGAAGSVLDVLGEPRLNHRPEVEGGLMAAEASALLRAFFADRR